MNCPVLLFGLLESEWRDESELKAALRRLRQGAHESERREIETFLGKMAEVPPNHVVNIACEELDNSLIMVPDDGKSVGDMFAEMLREFQAS